MDDEGVVERALQCDCRVEMRFAEQRAWDALSRYKFWMFGYFAARWVFLKSFGGLTTEPNPFRDLVVIAKSKRTEKEK